MSLLDTDLAAELDASALPAAVGKEPGPGRLRAVPVPDVPVSDVPARGVPVPAVPVRGVPVRRWQHRYAALVLVLDAVSGAVGSLAAAGFSGTIRADRDALLVPPYVAVWLLALAAGRTYETRRLAVGSIEFARVARSAMALFTAVALTDVVLDVPMGRPAALAIGLTAILAMSSRALLRRGLRLARWRGRCIDRVVVVGGTESVAQVVAALRPEVGHGLEIVGACLTDLGRGVPTVAAGRAEDRLGIAVLGGLEDVPEAVVATGSQLVAVAGGGDLPAGTVRHLAWSLESLGTEILVSPGLAEVAGQRLTVRSYPTLPLLHVEQPRLSGPARAVKGLGDRAAAVGLLLLLLPVFAVVAVLIAVDSRGPVLFRQTRVGLGGRTFTVWKFRSMVPGAEAVVSSLAGCNDHDGVLFKMRADPRVTRVGRVLRRLSLDELPQLLNVLGGTMSLVGPRPPLPREVENYAHDVRRRLLVKPGMTGLWQISGRSDLSWQDSVRLDLRYVENWSVALDVSILWRTLSAVLRGSGAY